MIIPFIRSLSKELVIAAFISIVFLVYAGACGAYASGETFNKKGSGLFSSKCAECHGVMGVGSKKGPPLVHKIYEPNHHTDVSFNMAIERGVRAHHWDFGDMPKIAGVSREEADEIIRYIRALQKEAGIF